MNERKSDRFYTGLLVGVLLMYVAGLADSLIQKLFL